MDLESMNTAKGKVSGCCHLGTWRGDFPRHLLPGPYLHCHKQLLLLHGDATLPAGQLASFSLPAQAQGLHKKMGTLPVPTQVEDFKTDPGTTGPAGAVSR
jgi:hypothetical protein